MEWLIRYASLSACMTPVILLVSASGKWWRRNGKMNIRMGLWLVLAGCLLFPFHWVEGMNIEYLGAGKGWENEAVWQDTQRNAGSYMGSSGNRSDGLAGGWSGSGFYIKQDNPLWYYQQENEQGQTIEIRNYNIPYQIPTGKVMLQKVIRSGLPMLWIAGIVCYLLWNLLAYGIARRRILRHSQKVFIDSGEGRRRRFVYRCQFVRVPMVLGICQNRIIVPDLEYDNREWDMILRHEEGHIANQDNRLRALLCLVSALHWFNPLVHIMRRAIYHDMEFHCDERVVRQLNKEERLAYNRVILRHAENAAYRGVSGVFAFSSALSGGSYMLKERFFNNMQKKKNHRFLAALLCMSLIVSALLAGCASDQVADKGQETLSGETGYREQQIVMLGVLHKDGYMDVDAEGRLQVWDHAIMYPDEPIEELDMEQANQWVAYMNQYYTPAEKIWSDEYQYYLDNSYDEERSAGKKKKDAVFTVLEQIGYHGQDTLYGLREDRKLEMDYEDEPEQTGEICQFDIGGKVQKPVAKVTVPGKIRDFTIQEDGTIFVVSYKKKKLYYATFDEEGNLLAEEDASLGTVYAADRENIYIYNNGTKEIGVYDNNFNETKTIALSEYFTKKDEKAAMDVIEGEIILACSSGVIYLNTTKPQVEIQQLFSGEEHPILINSIQIAWVQMIDRDRFYISYGNEEETLLETYYNESVFYYEKG